MKKLKINKIMKETTKKQYQEILKDFDLLCQKPSKMTFYGIISKAYGKSLSSIIQIVKQSKKK